MTILNPGQLVAICRNSKEKNYYVYFSIELFEFMGSPKKWEFHPRNSVEIKNRLAIIQDYDSEWASENLSKLHPQERPYIPYNYQDIKITIEKLVKMYKLKFGTLEILSVY